MPLLDGWGVPSRLASKAGFPGCYDGFVTQLADEWLGSLDAAAKAEVEVFSCGPTPMLEAMAKVAVKHGVPCQVSLEEFMACAVGGCAGCTVRGEHAGRPGDETRVRRRPGVRFQGRVRLSAKLGDDLDLADDVTIELIELALHGTRDSVRSVPPTVCIGNRAA